MDTSRHSILYICTDPGVKARRDLFARLQGMYAVSEGMAAPDELAQAQLLKTPNGKPYLEREAQTSVSITHSAGLYGAAFSDGLIGVDIQKKIGETGGSVADPMRIAERVFHPIDVRWMTDGDVRTRFFFLWTAFEAYAKFTGDGIFTRNRPIVHPSWEEFPGLHVVTGEPEEDLPEIHGCMWLRYGVVFTSIWLEDEFVCTCVSERPLDKIVFAD